MTRSPSLSSAPPMTITGPTGPPSVVGASRSGIDASVIPVSVPAFELRRYTAFCGTLYDWCHICASSKVGEPERQWGVAPMDHTGWVTQRTRDRRPARGSCPRTSVYRQYEYSTVLESYGRCINIRSNAL